MSRLFYAAGVNLSVYSNWLIMLLEILKFELIRKFPVCVAFKSCNAICIPNTRGTLLL